MTADDRRLLCEKMGRCWHDWELYFDHSLDESRYKCKLCGEWAERANKWTFTTVQEREDMMQWAFKQEWWEGVYLFAWCRYHEEQHTGGQCSTLHGYIKWLFQKPAHLPELVLQYGKEVLGWEPKGG